MIRAVHCTVGGVWLLWVGCIAAQDLDTALFAGGRRPSTVLDELQDRGERKAFLKIFREHNPAARRRMAAKFLADYPASWLLAQVYEAAAKACMDLKDDQCALEMGQRSLRLLPENALLLVPLAAVEFQRGLLDRARDHASDAIEYLDRFAGPPDIRAEDWSNMVRELSGAAYLTLARVYSMQGLAQAGANRKRLLEQALEAIAEAKALHPRDPEVLYLRGVMLVALGRARESWGDFEAAAAIAGPVQERARAQLRKLGAGENGTDKLISQTTATAPRVLPATPKTYAGSDACRSCHAAEFEAWQRTGMAKMLRAYKPENVIGDFTDARQFAGRNSDPAAYMKVEHDRHVFQIRAEDGVWHRYPVDYTIGSKWQQAYATKLPDGRIQVFPIQYNVLRHEWINYWQRIDPPGSERAEVRTFHRMPESANFQRNCAPCHTSQLREGPNHDPDRSSFREGGINCEMCHGPAEEHVAAKREGRTIQKRPWEPPVDFAHLESREAVRICAQCHMQSALRESSNIASGEIFPNYRQRPYQEFLRKAFYKDGRFRETTFIAEAFMRSRCFRKGGAQCGHCHNPHLPGASGEQTSFKFATAPDEMCLQCHNDLRYDAGRPRTIEPLRTGAGAWRAICRKS